jgi:hypothetical protein
VTEPLKIVWLKRLLMLKILVTVLMWGLPPWIWPASLLARFVEVPDPPFYMRLAGANAIAISFLFWFAFKNPARNRDTIRYAVVDNAIAFVTVIGYVATVGTTNPLVWVSAVLLLGFAIGFYVLIPDAGLEPAYTTVQGA